MTRPRPEISEQASQYRFTDPAARRATSQCWSRDCPGVYAPEHSLADFKPPPAD